MSENVKVIAFINQFFKPGRMEVLIDWTDDWHADDPFKGATWRLAHTPATNTPAPPAEYPIVLAPLVIDEVSEQLVAIGVNETARLAPDYVSRTVQTISGSLAVAGAMSALSMTEFTDRKPLFAGSANFLADLDRWTREPVPGTNVGMFSQSSNELLSALTSVVEAANQAPPDKSNEDRESFSVDSVVRSPETFQSAVEAAAGAGGTRALLSLEGAIRNRALTEQLIYAEALRRDQIYSRVRTEQQPNLIAAMTATDPTSVKRNQRADIRRVSRDEPVVGAMFHVLRWFSLPNGADAWDDLDIWVRPFIGDTAMPGFEPVPTRAKNTGPRVVTVLRRDELPTYFAEHVTVRQIAPALLLDDPQDTGGNPAEAVSRLRRMAATGQTLPPIHHLATADTDLAFAVHTQAHEPAGKASEYIFIKDKERELADAAESVRRNAPPHDTVGITWERALTSAIVNGTQAETPYFTGFKGYRIDAREAGSEEWKSLCTVERELFDERGEAVLRTRRPRESYVVQPIQNHSADKKEKPTVLTMPADFVEWAGGSTVVAAAFDRLGEALAPPSFNGSLISLREIGTTSIYPRYGRAYEFRVRGVGITGTGPGALIDEGEGACASVEFKRGVPMDAPAAWPHYIDLQPMDDQCRPVKPQDGEVTPDTALLATSRNARIEIETALPLAHWRVALHARGLTRDEQTVDCADLEGACARFVARSRENWRRRQARMPDAETLKPAAHLSAADPHCGAVQVTTRAWLPFSLTRDQDRFIVIGRETRRRDDVSRASFSRLVTMGEDLIETGRFDDRFVVSLDDNTLPSQATELAKPRVLAGFHCNAEVAATWADDTPRHYPGDEGRLKWTRHVFAGNGERRPIGGTIRSGGLTFEAGTGNALLTQSVFIDAAYSAIFDLEKERDLVMPLPPPPPQNDCTVKGVTPAHAEAVRWRKIFFDRDCAAQPATAACRTNRDIYRRFVGQQLGASVDDSNRHPNQLAFCLEPQLVERGAHSLVLPVFTFPVTATYDTAIPLPSAGDALSTVVRFGEFGAAGVTAIRVESGGSGYANDEEPGITLTAGNNRPGSGARANAVIENGAITAITIEDGGRDYEEAPAITIAPPANGGSAATATVTAIGETVRRKLPWVDADIVWTIRLGWRVPLEGSGIDRPLELSAVREFKLFRRDTRPGVDGTGSNRPLAVITRPGHDVLETIDLDHVEFTWVDAITDRDRHEFEYTIVAVPEDCQTFREQTWWTFKVSVPDSRIAARPESAHFLPMLAKQESAETNRSVAIYFSDENVRRDTDHVTLFFARAADDPMLAIEPNVIVAGSRAPYEPAQWGELFPAVRVAVTPVRDWNQLQAQRAGRDGIVAPPSDCTPAPENRRGRVFIASSRVPQGPLIKAASGELGNPFFKLHLHGYDDKRFPALAHTAASEPAETDWLQFYPDDLRWSADAGVLSIASPWGRDNNDARNVVWYRFHFFVPATNTLSIHVSTFYSHGPELALNASQRAAILNSLQRFTGTPASRTRLFVRAEEGILAETYAVEESGGSLNAVEDAAQRFVVLRSTPAAKEVEIAR